MGKKKTTSRVEVNKTKRTVRTTLSLVARGASDRCKVVYRSSLISIGSKLQMKVFDQNTLRITK